MLLTNYLVRKASCDGTTHLSPEYSRSLLSRTGRCGQGISEFIAQIESNQPLGPDPLAGPNCHPPEGAEFLLSAVAFILANWDCVPRAYQAASLLL